MNDITYTIYIIATIYSSIMLSIALVVLGVTLPKIIQESRVRNGLVGFRRLLLTSGSSIFLLALIALVIITGRFIFSLEYIRYISFVLLMIFSTIVLIIAVTKYKIYTYQFSTQSKRMHDRIADIEIKEDAHRETVRIKLNKDRREETAKRNIDKQ